MHQSDATTAARLGVAAAKIGATGLALMSSEPSTALLATAAIEMTDVLASRHEGKMADFIGHVAHKVQELPENLKARWWARFTEPEGFQFFEAAWHQAAETVDPLKLKTIAALVKNSLSAEELKAHESRWLLRLVDQLDSIEVILLQWHTKLYRNDQTFLAQHKLLLESAKPPESPSESHPELFGFYHNEPMSDSEQQLRDKVQFDYQLGRERYALHLSRINHLVGLSLIGEIPAFSSSQLGVTPLGAALLKIVDIVQENEWGEAPQANVIHAFQAARSQAADVRRTIQEKEKQYNREAEKNAKEFLSAFERGLRNAKHRY